MPKKSFLALVALALASGAATAVVACSSSSSTTPSTEDAGGEDDAATDSATAPPENVLDNPSFEKSGLNCDSPWVPLPENGADSTLDTATQGKTGARSCKICNLGTAPKEIGVMTSVPIVPAPDGKTPWALEAHFRDLDGGTGDGGNGAVIRLIAKDVANRPVLPSSKAESSIQTSAWRNLATPVTPAKATETLEARVGGLINPGGCILVDDVTVYRAQ